MTKRVVLILFMFFLVMVMVLTSAVFQLSAKETRLKYADFESGFFESSYTWKDSAKGADVTSSIFKGGFKSDYCLKTDYKFGGWGCGFQIWNDTGIGRIIDCSGAQELEFWVKMPVGTELAVGFEDGDNEQWRFDALKQIKTGWQRHTVPLNNLKIVKYAGNQNGNKKIDLQKVKGMQFTIINSVQVQGEMFLDEIIFIGAKGKVKQKKKVSNKVYFNKTVKIKKNWFYVNGKKFFVKGIGYSPCRPGTVPGGHIDIKLVEKDFKLIKDAGFNTVRTWGPMCEEWLELAKKYDLMVIQGIWIDPDRSEYSGKSYIAKSVNEVKRVVNYSRYYDNVLMYLVFNEPHADVIFKTGVKKTQKFFKKLREAVRSLDPNRPVSISSCAMDGFVDHSEWDVAAFNVYMYGPAMVTYSMGYRGYLKSLIKQYASEKPFIITEFGLPVSKAGPGKFGYGGNTADEQKQCVIIMYKELINAGASGGCVFEWIDEWWKAGDENKHNDNPEEWFGIMAIEGEGNPETSGVPRPVYNALKKFNQAVLIEPKDMKRYLGKIAIEVFSTKKVRKILYRVDKKKWRRLKKKRNWWKGKLNTLKYKDGYHDFEIKALGKNGKLIKKQSIKFAVFNKNKNLMSSPVKVVIKPKKNVYRTGETVKCRVKVTDNHNNPIKNKSVLYSLFWPKNWQELVFEKKTDDKGVINFSYPLKYQAKEDNFTISAGVKYMEGGREQIFSDLKNIKIKDGGYIVKKRRVNIQKREAKIKIDGNIDKAWDSAYKIYIRDIVDGVPQVRNGSWDGVKDCSAEIRLLYDDKYIYLLAEIKDDIPAKNNKTGDRIWDGDALEFFISTDPSGIPEKGYSSNEYQIVIGANETMWIFGQTYGGTRNIPPEDSLVNVKKTDNSYIIEACLSLNNFVDWKGTGEIGIDFAVDDEDETDGRKCQIIWNGDTGNCANADKWGEGFLK